MVLGDATKWTHYVCGVHCETREQAAEAMFDYYDSHHGRRRRPSRTAFEVYRAKQTAAGWILYVKER